MPNSEAEKSEKFDKYDEEELAKKSALEAKYGHGGNGTPLIMTADEGEPTITEKKEEEPPNVHAQTSPAREPTTKPTTHAPGKQLEHDQGAGHEPTTDPTTKPITGPSTGTTTTKNKKMKGSSLKRFKSRSRVRRQAGTSDESDESSESASGVTPLQHRKKKNLTIHSGENSVAGSEAAHKELDTNVLLANLTVQLDKLSRQLEASQSEATKQKEENKELQSILQAMEAGQSTSRGEKMWARVDEGRRVVG